ncbi:hypothetical protein GCM10010353_42700 [Streptomyces chryseus]|nr:hypothetical protein GCM10010353_42700 [Streptomyces chryseus]
MDGWRDDTFRVDVGWALARGVGAYAVGGPVAMLILGHPMMRCALHIGMSAKNVTASSRQRGRQVAASADASRA